MRQWLVIYRKEMLEMQRNYKWLWVPLVFILLGIMQPITAYFTPQILKNFGNLPEGTVIQIPLPSAGEVMFKTLSQFGTLGILILVLSSMAVFAGERQSGVLGIIMIKPVSHFSFITAKWAGVITLTWVSFVLGYLGSWYYTDSLIGSVNAISLIRACLLYGLWLTIVVSITILMSVVLKSNGGIAFVSILAVAGFSIITSLFSKYTQWSPARLSDYAGSMLMKGTILQGLPLCLILTFLMIVGLVVLAVYVFKRKESLYD